MHIESVQRFNILFSISFNFFILIYIPQMFVTLKSDISWGSFKHAPFCNGGCLCLFKLSAFKEPRRKQAGCHNNSNLTGILNPILVGKTSNLHSTFKIKVPQQLCWSERQHDQFNRDLITCIFNCGGRLHEQRASRSRPQQPVLIYSMKGDIFDQFLVTDCLLSERSNFSTSCQRIFFPKRPFCQQRFDVTINLHIYV